MSDDLVACPSSSVFRLAPSPRPWTAACQLWAAEPPLTEALPLTAMPGRVCPARCAWAWDLPGTHSGNRTWPAPPLAALRPPPSFFQTSVALCPQTNSNFLQHTRPSCSINEEPAASRPPFLANYLRHPKDAPEFRFFPFLVCRILLWPCCIPWTVPRAPKTRRVSPAHIHAVLSQQIQEASTMTEPENFDDELFADLYVLCPASIKPFSELMLTDGNQVQRR